METEGILIVLIIKFITFKKIFFFILKKKIKLFS